MSINSTKVLVKEFVGDRYLFKSTDISGHIMLNVKTPDNRHYEKVGSETKDITGEIPFEIPENWVWCRFGNIINLISGRDLPPNDYTNIHTNGCIPYITGASNIGNENVLINRWTQRPQTLSCNGDLLLTCKGTVGLIAFLQCEKAHIARQIMAIQSTSSINIFYLKYFIMSYLGELQRKVKSMIPGISRKDVLQILCPLPPLSQQNAIVIKIDKLLETIENL